MKNNLRTFPKNDMFADPWEWKYNFEVELRERLKTLREDTIKYKDCEFNAPKIREGMILQLEEILGE